MKRWGLIVLASVIAPGPALAQLYKCVDGNRAVYSERPMDCDRELGKTTKRPAAAVTDDAEQSRNVAAELQAEFEREKAARLQKQRAAEEAERFAEARKAACAVELSKAPVVRNSAWDGGVFQVEQYLKRVLKDPKSFEAISWSPVTRSCTGYVVRVRYRARNSFGGMVISEQIFSMDTAGYVTGVVDL